MDSHWVDILAVGFFVIEWVAYAFTVERTPSRDWRQQFASNAWRAMGG